MPSVDCVATGAKVLVLGGSYGGLAAALNLLDLCAGKPARFAPSSTEKSAAPKRATIPIQIKVVDERDGYCRYRTTCKILTDDVTQIT